MSEELTPASEELIVLPIEEQISQELVKANVTEAVIASLREKYMPLSIEKAEDKKEAYLLVKEGRKECKSIRIMASKICKKGREGAVKIQKAWIKTEDEVTGRISEIEDYLEKQEVEYEAEVAKEKEARKRKQEEQLIVRQQTLTNMGALYSDGAFTLGDVSYEYSLIKESDEDVWEEAILPKFKEEYEKVQAEQIEKNRLKEEAEAELKRQQEELEQKKKELAEEALRMKAEKDRQELEAAKRRSDQFEFRSQQLKSMGFDVYGVEWYAFREFKIAMAAVWDWDDYAWGLQLISAKQYIDQVLAEEAEEKRKEQERKELQAFRYNELYPYIKYGGDVDVSMLWSLTEGSYLVALSQKKDAFEKAEEEKAKQIAEKAAKEERERIEEEQRQAEARRIKGLREFRVAAIDQYNMVYNGERGDLGLLNDDQWWLYINDIKATFEETKRKQEEERKAEELAKAGDKEKWNEIMERVEAIEVYAMRSSQYRKKAAILREKLEEIKAL